MFPILFERRKPVVFGRSSLELWDTETRNQFELRPPIQRGDLDSLMEELPGVCIIVDGIFGGKMAITPTECRLLMEKGWILLGSSSMGALRAADLWSLGMIGVGEVYSMYRLGKCLSDAEVAVTYDQEIFEEKTLSLVHIRSLLGKMIQNSFLDIKKAQELLEEVRRIPWFERLPQLFEQIVGKSIEKEVLQDLLKDPLLHPKKKDALHLLELIKTQIWPNEHLFLQKKRIL